MKIEWNKVTWYSKALAVAVFLGTFVIAFYLGTRFGVELAQMGLNIGHGEYWPGQDAYDKARDSDEWGNNPPGNTHGGNLNPPVSGEPSVACPAIAKACPDGSYVSPEGPRCEFAPCPGQ